MLCLKIARDFKCPLLGLCTLRQNKERHKDASFFLPLCLHLPAFSTVGQKTDSKICLQLDKIVICTG